MYRGEIYFRSLWQAIQQNTHTHIMLQQAAESRTVRGTAVGSRPFAADAEATSTADMADPFATGDAPGTDATMTVTAIVVSAGATAAVAVDKQISRGDTCFTFYIIQSCILVIFYPLILTKYF